MKNFTRQIVILIFCAMVLYPQVNHSQPQCSDNIATTRLQQLPSEGWRIVHDREGMIIYNRKSAGSGINEVLALTKMERPASRLFAVVSGYPQYPLFMPYVIKSEVLQENENKVWVFQELDFPWPISNRYYTIELTTNKEQSAQGHYLISWTLAQTAQESITGKGVKLERDDGYWLFCTLGGNQTFVEYYIHSNPGGILPSRVVNEANTRAVPEVLKAVRQRSKTEVPQGESGR